MYSTSIVLKPEEATQVTSDGRYLFNDLHADVRSFSVDYATLGTCVVPLPRGPLDNRGVVETASKFVHPEDRAYPSIYGICMVEGERITLSANFPRFVNPVRSFQRGKIEFEYPHGLGASGISPCSEACSASSFDGVVSLNKFVTKVISDYEILILEGSFDSEPRNLVWHGLNFMNSCRMLANTIQESGEITINVHLVNCLTVNFEAVVGHRTIPLNLGGPLMNTCITSSGAGVSAVPHESMFIPPRVFTAYGESSDHAVAHAFEQALGGHVVTDVDDVGSQNMPDNSVVVCDSSGKVYRLIVPEGVYDGSGICSVIESWVKQNMHINLKMFVNERGFTTIRSPAHVEFKFNESDHRVVCALGFTCGAVVDCPSNTAITSSHKAISMPSPGWGCDAGTVEGGRMRISWWKTQPFEGSFDVDGFTCSPNDKVSVGEWLMANGMLFIVNSVSTASNGQKKVATSSSPGNGIHRVTRLWDVAPEPLVHLRTGDSEDGVFTRQRLGRCSCLGQTWEFDRPMNLDPSHVTYLDVYVNGSPPNGVVELGSNFTHTHCFTHGGARHGVYHGDDGSRHLGGVPSGTFLRSIGIRFFDQDHVPVVENRDWTIRITLNRSD